VKILFTRFPYESANGGAENQTTSLMQGLIDRGHLVSFLGSCSVLLERCKQLSIEHSTLRIGNPPVTKLGAMSFVWRQISMRKKLQNALDRVGDIDAICMISLSEKILLTPYALQKGIKVFWIEHDTVSDWLAKNPSLPLLQKMSEDVTTICVSQLSADIFRNLGYSNVLDIPNGVPLPPERFRKHTAGKTVCFGCIARLSEEKGVDLLVDAIQDLDVQLIITGAGALTIPTSKSIQVIDHVDDIEEIYTQIDVLVLPSRKEDPFGLVVAEAALRGIATICTDVCGIAGYLHDGKDTLVVPADDCKALVKAVQYMQDFEHRSTIALAGLQTAQEKFTVEKMVLHYEKVLSM
jgi:glycosyltransferase involved in cell wall biosynthesis